MFSEVMLRNRVLYQVLQLQLHLYQVKQLKKKQHLAVICPSFSYTSCEEQDYFIQTSHCVNGADHMSIILYYIGGKIMLVVAFGLLRKGHLGASAGRETTIWNGDTKGLLCLVLYHSTKGVS